MIQGVQTIRSDMSLKEGATTIIDRLSICLVVKNGATIQEIIANKLMMLSDGWETQIIWTRHLSGGCRD